MKTVIAYTRVSSGKQLDGNSLEAQADKFKNWCTLHEVPFNPENVLSDRGISGKNIEDRPAIQEAVDRVCDAGSDGVLWCFSLSRFGRSACEALSMANRIKKAGATLVLFSDSCDTSTATGRLLFTILAGVAEMEREHISCNTKNAMTYMRSIGRRTSRRAPYGTRHETCGVKQNSNKPIFNCVPDPEEQTTIAVAQSLRMPGATLRDISNMLAYLGRRNRVGRPFAPAVLASIFRNADAKEIAA